MHAALEVAKRTMQPWLQTCLIYARLHCSILKPCWLHSA